jgi:hypothetical protein
MLTAQPVVNLRRRTSHAPHGPIFALFALASPGLASSQNFDAVEIWTQQVSSNVYMFLGQGGNIGVFVGEDGVFVIDDQLAPLTDKILAAIGAITSEPVRFVFNSMRDAVAALMEEGHSLERIQDSCPIQDQAEAWGQNEAAERNFVATIHHGLAQ